MLAILDQNAAGVKSASENLAKVMADKAAAEALAIASLTKFTLGIDGTILKSTVLNGDLALVSSGLRGFTSALVTTGPFQGATGFTPFPPTTGGGFTSTGGGPFQGATGFTSSTNAADMAAAIAALNAATAAANAAAAAASAAAKTPVIKVVTDPTVIVQVVQDAIVDNGRSGNILFPPGSLLSTI